MNEIKKTYRSEEVKKNINNRINKIIGQMNGIKNMIEDDRYCYDIIIQLSAIANAIKSLENNILDNHIKGCILAEVKKGNDEALDEIIELIKRM